MDPDKRTTALFQILFYCTKPSIESIASLLSMKDDLPSVAFKVQNIPERNTNDNFTMLPSYSDFSLIDLSLSLAQYMKSLSPTRQRILQYALIDEYSSSEIAAKMQLSVQYVNRIKKEFLAERRKFT